jgi:hypothetical protein
MTQGIIGALGIIAMVAFALLLHFAFVYLLVWLCAYVLVWAGIISAYTSVQLAAVSVVIVIVKMLFTSGKK